MTKREMEIEIGVLIKCVRNLEREIGILKCAEHDWVKDESNFNISEYDCRVVNCKYCGLKWSMSLEDFRKHRLELAKREMEKLSRHEEN